MGKRQATSQIDRYARDDEGDDGCNDSDAASSSYGASQESQTEGEWRASREQLKARSLSVPRTSKAKKTAAAASCVALTDFSKQTNVPLVAATASQCPNRNVEIHGLNNSFVKFITAQYDKNPLVDLRGAFQKYTAHWSTISGDGSDKASSTIAAKPEGAAKQPLFDFKLPDFKPAVGENAAKSSASALSFDFAPKTSDSSPFKPPMTNFSFNSTAPSALSSADSKPFSFSFASSDSVKAPSFSFAPSAAVSASNNHNNKASSKDSDGEDGDDVDVEESSQKESSPPEIVFTGVGEENEDTLLKGRCKLFSYKDKAYIDKGIVVFKVNQDRNNQKTRIFCLNERSGTLLLNSLLKENCAVTRSAGKKDLMLVCFDLEGNPASFLLRSSSPEEAVALFELLNKHIPSS